MKPLTPMRPDKYLSLQALPPHRRRHEDEREREEAEHGDVSSKRGRLAPHLRGMQPAPTSKKDTLMLRKISNSNTNDQTLN